MRQVSPWRWGLILAVTVLSIWFVLPTGRYLIHLAVAPEEGTEAYTEWEEKKEELQKEAVPLGLDLRGGVDVTLMIDPKASSSSAARDMITRLNNSFDTERINATAVSGETEAVLVVEIREAADARRVHNVLARFETELTGDYTQATLERDKRAVIGIDADAANEEVEADIRSAEKIIRERVDRFGLAQPSISIQGRNKIRIQLPGTGDPQALIENLTQLAHMEFRLTHPDYQTIRDPLNDLLDENGEVKLGANIPLGYEVLPYKFGNWNRDTQKTEYTYGKILVGDADHLLFTGESLRGTGVIQDQMDLDNPIKVSLRFDREAGRIFAEATQKSVEGYKNTGRNYDHLAIILDGEVRTAPTLGTIITGGSAVIEGGFSFDDAQDLSFILKAGSLPAKLIVESQSMVTASLGDESIYASVKALAIGTLLVVIFMIAYYGMAGLISIVALILNMLIIVGIMALSNATLTLSGIGGILLTVGMAVDANVLIYERIREEFDGGRPLRQAITVGFDRAFTVILDSNLTTLMAALVLLQFTAGNVFGFALTMTFGLLANLYTGLTVTYTLCLLWFNWREKLSLGFLRPFKKATYDFIKMRYTTWVLSLGFLAAGLGLVTFSGGLTFGVDFSGGLVADVRFTEDTTESAVREVLTMAGLEGQRVQRVPDSNDFVIRVKTLDPQDERVADLGILSATENVLRQALADRYGAEDEAFIILSGDSFGAETGQTFRTMAISVIILASLAILAYLWLRFELIFGVAAVIALVHDLFITVFWSSMWGVEITLDVVAALLVLLGYSVNDTIVVFDRIRENTRRGIGKTFKETCNFSMNQSLSRTLITTITALFVIVVMLFIGGEGLKPFAKVLLIGSMVGIYSSSFVAAPLVFQWNERHRRGGADKGKLVEALQAKSKPRGPEPAKAPKTSAKTGTGAGVPSRRAV